MVRFALSSAAMLMLSTAAASAADTTISGGLIVQGSACVGSGCTSTTTFDYSTVIVSGDSPTILFNDTSGSGSYPTTDWSVGTSGGVFAITNVDTGQTVMQVSPTGNGVALGAGSTLVDGAISVGSDTQKRRITNVADGVDASDVATYGQLVAAMSTAPTTNTALLQENSQRIDQLTHEVAQVGAMSSAFSSLTLNPRGEGDNFFSVGMGAYDGASAFAAGSYHFLDGGKILINTGVARATEDGAHTAFRLGFTFGG